MEKQKSVQKTWYKDKPLEEGGEIIQISTHTHIKRLKDLIPPQEARLSLNCGCGNGSQKNLFGPSIGIDISYENIRSFVRSGGVGLVADMEFLPFRDETFDLVYGFGILHHLNDIRKGLSEATRVLIGGGYIGFGGENNGWCPLTYLMAFIYGNWKIEKGFYRIRRRSVKKLFQDLGISEIRISVQGMTIYGMGRKVYQWTSCLERVVSRIPWINRVSGYCYVAGKTRLKGKENPDAIDFKREEDRTSHD
jgi:SAM-dependent methyltransferase